MISVDSGLLALILFLAFLAFVVVMIARSENAKNERWVEAMRELGQRCPDCGGMGWHFGPPGTGDPEKSTPTCRTCNGTGKLERTLA